MINLSFRRGASFAVASLFILVGSVAPADTFTSIISSGNSAISGFPGPYGTVLVTLTSPTMATITFTSNAGFLFGGVNAADVNLNATTFTESFVSATGPNTPPTFVSFGSGNVDAQGSFNSTLKLFDGFTRAANTITFDVTNTSGTFSSAADVLTANSLGIDAAAHVFVCSDPTCSGSGGAAATGFAGEIAGTGTVPEPAGVLLLGTLGAAGLLFGRKVRSARQS